MNPLEVNAFYSMLENIVGKGVSRLRRLLNEFVIRDIAVKFSFTRHFVR